MLHAIFMSNKLVQLSFQLDHFIFPLFLYLPHFIVPFSLSVEIVVQLFVQDPIIIFTIRLCFSDSFNLDDFVNFVSFDL